MSTFHALCVRILRQDIDKLGYKRNFSIYDEGDQMGLIKKIITRTAAQGREARSERREEPDQQGEEQRLARSRTGRRADAARRGLRALPGGAEDAERGRFRRPAAAHGEAAHRARRGARALAAAVSLPDGR